MKWSILILTQPSRRELLKRLLAILLPQMTQFGHPLVELIINEFDAAKSLGANRQHLRESAKGEYLNFIDDDDLVALDYVPSVLPLLDGVDYIGFRLQQFTDGKKLKPTFNSIRYQRWYDDDNGFYRDLSHVCPMRRELALLVPMTGNFGEDARWASELRELGVVKTEHFIDRVMYEYHYRSQKMDGPAR